MLARIKRNLTTGELEIQKLSGMSPPLEVIKYVTTLPVSPDIQDMIYAVAQASGRYKYYAGDEDNQTLQELGGGSYDDTELRNRITQAEDNIGTLANLKTRVKTDLVSAINEIVPDVSAATSVTSGNINFTQSFITILSGGYAKWEKSGKIVKITFFSVNVTKTQTTDISLASGLPIPALNPSIGDISYINGRSGIEGQGLVLLAVNSNGELYTQGASLPQGILHGSFVYIAQ